MEAVHGCMLLVYAVIAIALLLILLITRYKVLSVPRSHHGVAAARRHCRRHADGHHRQISSKQNGSSTLGHIAVVVGTRHAAPAR